jgi:hypothetical protein
MTLFSIQQIKQTLNYGYFLDPHENCSNTWANFSNQLIWFELVRFHIRQPFF